jgi:hypothetical protein
MSWAARKSLILSRISKTFRLSYKDEGVEMVVHDSMQQKDLCEATLDALYRNQGNGDADGHMSRSEVVFRHISGA